MQRIVESAAWSAEDAPEHSLDALVNRGRSDPEFEDMHIAVELIFQELGARVCMGVADAGEPPAVSLHIPHARSEAMEMFSNRPA